MNKALFLTIFLIGVLSVCQILYADVIYLKNGKVMVGRIVEKNEQFLILKTGEGVDAVKTTIFLDDINKTEKEEVYSKKVSLIPFQLFQPRPAALKAYSQQDSIDRIKGLLIENREFHSSRFEETGPSPEEKNIIKLQTFFMNQEQLFQIRDIYYQKLPLNKPRIFLVIKNISGKPIESLRFDVVLNDINVFSVPLEFNQIGPNQEKEFDIAYIYTEYEKLLQETGRVKGTRMLKFKIIWIDTREVVFEKSVLIF